MISLKYTTTIQSLNDAVYGDDITGLYHLKDATSNSASSTTFSNISIFHTVNDKYFGRTYGGSTLTWSNSSSGTLTSSNTTHGAVWQGWTYLGANVDLTINSNPRSEDDFTKIKALLLKLATSTPFPKTVYKYNYFDIPETSFVNKTVTCSSTIRVQDTFTVSSSNTSVATVNMNESNQIIINCLKTGTTTITVTSNSDSSITGQQTFIVANNQSSFKSLSVSEYDNYIELSLDGVTYEIKLNTSNLITFSISLQGVVTEYQAEQGMTWSEFIESSYNTNNDVHLHSATAMWYKLSGHIIYDDSQKTIITNPVDTIIADKMYYAGMGD